MKRREFNKAIATTTVILPFFSKVNANSVWSLEANLAECCSCEIPCPCNFGRATTKRCDGSRLIEIYKGNLDDIDLTGIRFVVTFEMGKWSRIYVDNKLDEKKYDAFDSILPLAFSGFSQQAQSIKKTPLSVTRENNRIKFSTPESQVEMQPLSGMDGGLISVSGLPYNSFYDYVQYESITHSHKGPKHQWSHKGTNGFTSRMITSSN